MVAEQFDYKKLQKDLYLPKTVPMIIDVPAMRFIMIDGKGNPNDGAGEYAKAIELLYGLSYAIKMSKRSGNAPQDYFDYVVPPLEGFWWTQADRPFDIGQKDQLIWTMMLRQPEFVTEDLFKWAVGEASKKKPRLDISKAKLAVYTEGLCVQMMHIGPFDTEAATVKAIDGFAASRGYLNAISDVLVDGSIRRHHEIYLSDLRKTAAEKLKTVVRHPIKEDQCNSKQEA